MTNEEDPTSDAEHSSDNEESEPPEQLEDQLSDSRRWVVKKVNRYGFKQRRICWFDLVSNKFHITDTKNKNPHAYDIRQFHTVAIISSKPQPRNLTILFSDFNAKNLNLVFASHEELMDFHSFCTELERR
jgi:hypothetical protein